MNVYILDVPSRNREQLLNWLSEDNRPGDVKVFEDNVKFIEQTGTSPPDICFIRLGNNEIPGLKTADMVRQIHPDVRVVFISDYSDYALDAYEVGAYGYLLCPIGKEKLEILLREEDK